MPKRKLKWKEVSLQLEVATSEEMEEEIDAGSDGFLFKASYIDESNIINDIEIRIKKRAVNNNSTPPKDVKSDRDRDRVRRRDRSRSRDRKPRRSRSRDRRRDRSRDRKRSRSRDRKRSKRSRSKSRDRERRREKRERSERGGEDFKVKDKPADTGYDAQYDNQGVYVKQEKLEEETGQDTGENGGAGGEQGEYDNGGAEY